MMSKKIISITAVVLFSLFTVVCININKSATRSGDNADILSSTQDTNTVSSDSSVDSDSLFNISDSVITESLLFSQDVEFSETLDSSAETVSEALQSELSEDSTSQDGENYMLDKYRDIIADGVYTMKVTRQKRIGGLSVPVVTVTVHGDGYTSITEYEAHDIYTEIFVNSLGAYFIDIHSNSCELFPSSTIQIQSLSFNSLKFDSTGTTTVSGEMYKYERYNTAEDIRVDFLFNENTLYKIKVYENEDYELLGLEIYDDTYVGRTHIPDDMLIIDRR